MKKKKLMLCFVAAAVGAFLLTGCQKEEAPGDSAAESVESTDGTQQAPAATDEEIAAAGFTSLNPGEDPQEAGELEMPEVLPAQGDEAGAEDTGDDGRSAAVILDTSAPLSGIHHAIIEVEDFGPIYVELDADQAPITVTNFVKLAQEGFYDGLTFHRVVKNFMIQGGDPKGNGTGGSDEPIKGEFLKNGVENTISHTRGTISMARTDDPDSASSQFFIMHQNYNRLDGEYAAFGHVTDGIEVVDAIVDYAETVKKDSQSGVIQSMDDQPVITTILIID